MASTGARAAAALAALGGCLADVTVIESSSTGEKWVNKGSLPWGPAGQASSYIAVDRGTTFQTIMGFGAATTDTSAANYQMMNDTSKAAFMTAYWGSPEEGGLGYTVHRVPINSPDFAVQSFNYDNVTDDFALAHFDANLTYDRQRVIPMIRDAQKRSKDPLYFFGSPWSPPGWMKTNNNMISSNDPCLKADTPNGSYAQAWAQYFVKWIAGMADAGVPMWGVTVQNEPGYRPFNYEGCLYTAEEHRDFVKNHLGPTLKTAYPDIKLMAFDYNKGSALPYIQTNYADPEAAQWFDGSALHWYDIGSTVGFDTVNAIHALNASKFIIATEACWIQGLVETWQTAELYSLDIATDLNAWAIGWTEWNPVLHYSNTGRSGRGIPNGGPNHDGAAFGSAMLLLQNDEGVEDLIYQSTYYAIGHFSRFVRPGAVRVSTAGSAGIATVGSDYETVRAHIYSGSKSGVVPLVVSAFTAADDASASVVVLNAGEQPVSFELRDAKLGAVAVTIPAHSLQTLTYPTQ